MSGMVSRIDEVVEKFKQSKVSVGERDGIAYILRLRGGYLEYDNKEWVVEMILVSGNDVASIREEFDDRVEAENLYQKLKSVYSLSDVEGGGFE